MAEAGEWFEPLGGRVEGLMVLSRADAEDAGAAAVLRAGPVHLPERQFAHAPAQRAEELPGVGGAARRRGGDGAVVVGSSGAAMALTDPMVDARGGG